MVGEVVERQDDWIRLTGASWVADSGRFGEAIARGTLSESEYVGDAYINISSCVDAFPWPHDLPTESK